MKTQAESIESFLKSARELIAQAVIEIRATDEEAYALINSASRAGAPFQLTTCLSTAGLCEIRVQMMMPAGELLNIACVEFKATH
jgi:hypothetical protein